MAILTPDSGSPDSRTSGPEGEVLVWLSDASLNSLPSSLYWNDEGIELQKPFHLKEGGNVGRLWTYLAKTTTFYAQYETVLQFASELGRALHGVGVDVASGVCWTSALLSKIGGVETIYAVDISRHRLFKLAPLVCKGFGAESSKIIRALGSFYDLRLSDGSADFCFLSQAFHHADQPVRLLRELRRVLKPGRPVLMIGESPITAWRFAHKWLRNIAKLVFPQSLYVTFPVRKVFPSFAKLFPADPVGGDHYYRLRDYERLFRENGFTLHSRRVGREIVFVAVSNSG